MAFRWVLTVVLLLMTTASSALARPVSPPPRQGVFLVEIALDACKPAQPFAAPTDPALPQPSVEFQGDVCLWQIESILNQYAPNIVPRPDNLRHDLTLLGLTDIVMWGPDAAPLFAGRSGNTCIAGEVGPGGHRVARVAPNPDGTCGPASGAAGR